MERPKRRVRLCQIERGGGKLVAEGDVRAVAPTENGKRMETLHLTNCKVGARDSFDDPEDVFYSLDVIRSKVNRPGRRFERQVDGRG